MLLDPLVSSNDISDIQHRSVLTAFLIQVSGLFLRHLRWRGSKSFVCTWQALKAYCTYFVKVLPYPDNTKGGSITVPLTSCLTGLESAVYSNVQFLFLFAKQAIPNQSNKEVNGTVILSPLVFPALPINLRQLARDKHAQLILF